MSQLADLKPGECRRVDQIDNVVPYVSSDEAVRQRAAGPYVVWENYGCEGWQPTSYTTLEAALTAQKYNSTWVIQKSVAFEIVEK